jgi:hypothetical protein
VAFRKTVFVKDSEWLNAAGKKLFAAAEGKAADGDLYSYVPVFRFVKG